LHQKIIFSVAVGDIGRIDVKLLEVEADPDFAEGDVVNGEKNRQLGLV